MAAKTEQEKVGLPPKPFLYTLDQVASILSVSVGQLKNRYIWWEGRQPGKRDADLILAVNIAPPTDKPEWRVPEKDLVRWLNRKGIKYYNRSWAAPRS